MTEWTMTCWNGAPEVAEASLRQLGWRGPNETPAEVLDPRIGGFIPPPGQPVTVVDGVAYVALVAAGPIEAPAGLAPTDPDLSRSLIGSF